MSLTGFGLWQWPGGVERGLSKILRIRDYLPSKMDGYHRRELRFHGTSPFVEACVERGPTKVNDWFLLDTGFNCSLGLTRDFWAKNAVGGNMDRLGSSSSAGLGKDVVRGEFYKIPGRVLGNIGMRAIPINVDAEPTGNPEATGGLGIDVLKRFDTVLDYRENLIYLKPNRLFGTPFRQPSDRMIPVILAGSVLLLVGATVFLASRRFGYAAIDSAITPSKPNRE